MLKRGANILHIQQLLGHLSPKTSQIYTRLYPRDLVSVYKNFIEGENMFDFCITKQYNKAIQKISGSVR